MRFHLISAHTNPLSRELLHIDLCVPRKTPPQTLPFCPLFQPPVSSPTRFWKPCTHHSSSIHADSPLLSTLPPTTDTTTRNIYTFTLFLRSILPSGKTTSLTQVTLTTTRSSSPCAQHRRITQDAPRNSQPRPLARTPSHTLESGCCSKAFQREGRHPLMSTTTLTSPTP
jgi:hypothetical protein